MSAIIAADMSVAGPFGRRPGGFRVVRAPQTTIVVLLGAVGRDGRRRRIFSSAYV
jgi:hypothetical protein